MSDSAHLREFRCKNCGASMRFDPRTLAIQCNYCGTQHAIDPEQAPTALRTEIPDAIVPFRIDGVQFQSRAADWFTRGFFTKDDLPLKADPQNLNGLYIPFYAYRLDYAVHFEVDIGYRVQVKRGKQTHTKIRWRPHNGDVQGVVSYEELTILASQQILTQHKDHVKFFGAADFSTEAKDFDSRYLLGFGCEPFDISPEQVWDSVGQVKALDRIRTRVVSMLPGDTFRRLNLNFTRADRMTKRLYYPFWIETYHYHGKPYRVFLDGQNGRASGTKPINGWKVALLPFLLGVVCYAAGVSGSFEEVLSESERGGLAAGVAFPLIALVAWFILDFVKRRSIRRSIQAGRPALPWLSKNGPIGLAVAASLCLIFFGVTVRTHVDASSRTPPPTPASAPPVATRPVAPAEPTAGVSPVEEASADATVTVAQADELRPRLLTLRITVDPGKPDGQPWDTRGGLPDVSASLTVDGARLEGQPCRDSLECVATFDDVPMRSGSKVVVDLRDRDGDSADPIGSTDWTWAGEAELAGRSEAAAVGLSIAAQPSGAAAGATATAAAAAPATGPDQAASAPPGAVPQSTVEEQRPAARARTGSEGGSGSAVAAPPARVCCMYCDTGKPCGNSCIARNRTCHRGRGCACAAGE